MRASFLVLVAAFVLVPANAQTLSDRVTEAAKPTAQQSLIADLWNELQAAQRDLAVAQASAAAAQGSVGPLQAQAAALQVTVNSLAAQVSDLQARLATVTQQGAADTATITSLNATIAALNDKVTALQAQLALPPAPCPACPICPAPVSCPPPVVVVPPSDFVTRCAQPGVIRCVGFDSAAEIAGGFGSNTGSMAGASAPAIDAAVKASGGGSLKFTVPSNSGADTSGSYFANFSTDLSKQFGENAEFYVQWRQRFSAEFLNTVYQGANGWKQIIIGTGDKPGVTASSCTPLETVVQNSLQRGFAQMYNSCTGSASHGPFENLYEPFGSSDFKLQNARPSPFCLYSQSAAGRFQPGTCLGYAPDEWMTFQIRIKTGPRVADEWQKSTVTLWIAREGQPSQAAINYTMNLTAGTADDRFGKVWLLPYNTNKSATQVHPTAFTWYDELIISTAPIADPLGVPPIIVTPPVVVTPPPVVVPGVAGWTPLPNTKLSAVCAATHGFQGVTGNTGCSAITGAWSGGVMDTARNRLVIWGGGHTDYAGNEVYALELDTGVLKRLNDPSPARDGCANGGLYADGKPSSRHTYNHLAYLPVQDAMFAWGGSQFSCGGSPADGWLLDMATLAWTKKASTNGPGGGTFNNAAAYDPNNGLIYMHDWNDLRAFNPVTNIWAKRSSVQVSAGNAIAAVVDPKRKRYYFSVSGSTTLRWYDVSSATASVPPQSSPTTGCAGFLGDANAGMEYDPVQDRIVGWNGGNTVYLLNPDTFSCSTVTTTGGPAATGTGTFGRFRYSPKSKAFAVCGRVDADCYLLRMGG